ncbi:MAG TPA: hypothetical protein VIH71_16665 [Solirubrobacteraceae bacterium]
MPPKDYEFVRGDPELLKRVSEEEDPEFVIEDATVSARLPQPMSSEAQTFIKAAEGVLLKLNESQGHNGHV